MALVLMNGAAIIDLGTNTFNLLIVKQYGEEYRIVFKTKIPAKLGAGGFAEKIITPEAFERGIAAIRAHQMTIREHRVDNIYAFATSAMRDAQNGAAFAQEVENQTGIEINIISGDREADLIHKGVSRALEIGDEPELIMDIGGGSTEFVIANNKQVLWKHSFDLGVSRIFEYLKPADPLTESDIKRFEAYLNEKMSILFEAVDKYAISGLIGSSGSFESLAEMILENAGSENGLKGKTEYSFSLKELKELHGKLIKSNANERAQMKGLVAYRIETIPLASTFINYTIKKFSLGKIRLSTYSLREGVISELGTD